MMARKSLITFVYLASKFLLTVTTIRFTEHVDILVTTTVLSKFPVFYNQNW